MDPVSQLDDASPPSLGDLLRQLIDDAIAYINAERAVYGVQAALVRRAMGRVALYAVGALVLALGAMIALVVGALLALTPVVGAVLAAVIVIAVCVAVAALLVWSIQANVRAVKVAWKHRHDG